MLSGSLMPFKGLATSNFREGGRDVPRLRRNAEEHRVIRHCVEIERLLQLEIEA